MIDESVIHEGDEGELSALTDRELRALESDPTVSRALLVAVVAEMMRRRREHADVVRVRPGGQEEARDAMVSFSTAQSTLQSTLQSTAVSTRVSTSASSMSTPILSALLATRGGPGGDVDDLRRALTRIGERLTRLERRATTLGWWVMALSGAWAIWVAATGARGRIRP